MWNPEYIALKEKEAPTGSRGKKGTRGTGLSQETSVPRVDRTTLRPTEPQLCSFTAPENPSIGTKGLSNARLVLLLNELLLSLSLCTLMESSETLQTCCAVLATSLVVIG